MRELVVGEEFTARIDFVEVGQRGGFVCSGCAQANFGAEAGLCLGKDVSEGRSRLVDELNAEGNTCDAGAHERS